MKILKEKLVKQVNKFIMTKKIKGTSERPRLYIYKSNKHLYAQIIDDINNKIIVSSSTISSELKNIYKSKLYGNCKTAKILGQIIAKKSKEKGLQELIFDRGSNIYHGQIKELANSAREEGMIF
uniref:Large ribosomal subunit protein uL18c n=1 Tax=Callithamnion tetricum TaxID=193179 RepID=A0A4D6WQK7_9FLOR|nr:ribosomal protein L18 [Callithamnion tetricum]